LKSDGMKVGEASILLFAALRVPFLLPVQWMALG